MGWNRKDFEWDGIESTESARLFMVFLGGPRDGERLRTERDNLPELMKGEGGAYMKHRPLQLPGQERRLIGFDYLWIDAVLPRLVTQVPQEVIDDIVRRMREQERRDGL